MKSFLLLLLTSLSLVGAGPRPVAGRSPAVDADFAPPAFTVPDGFEVELVAGPPLVHHPIMAGFDEQGRLYVAETTGDNLNNKELDERKPHYITLLEDADGDGYFDRSVRFAEDFTFPQGALWHDGALYVSSPPGLWKLEDTDGDGKADRRTQLADGFAYTGNAADVHGPFLGPTGRLFWCHGRKGHEVYDQQGRLVSKGKGARIWTCRTDGSDLRFHAGGGMDNPTELVFMPNGEMVGTVNLFYGRPRGDVLVHWLHGGVYPRRDQQPVLGEFPRTGDLLTEIVNFGHVAVSGLTRYQSAVFGEDYRDNVFVTFFNTHKVARTVLRPQAATFAVETREFLEAHHPDFHCTDVLEDVDGSLLVIDTGGWFRIGCPTSQLAKPDVQGAIYRVRRKGGAAPVDPRGKFLRWHGSPLEELVARLDDPRFAVRERAMAALVRQGEPAVPGLKALLEKGRMPARREAVWALSRIGSPAARAELVEALSDEAWAVRQSAALALGWLEEPVAVPALGKLLREDASASVQREAAAALGRIGGAEGVPPLMERLAGDLDRPLEHAVMYALLELGRAEPLQRALANREAVVRRRALIVLDQMEKGRLGADRVLSLLEDPDVWVRATAAEVAATHPEWAGELASRFDGWARAGLVNGVRREVLLTVIPPLLGEAAPVRDWVTGWFERAPDWPEVRMPMELVARSVGGPAPEPWVAAVKRGLKSGNPDFAEVAVRAAGALRVKALDPALQALSGRADRPPLIRVKALTAVSGSGGGLEASAFDLLLGLLGNEVNPGQQAEAARLLGQSRLTRPQLLALAPRVAQAGPLVLPPLMETFRRSRDGEVGTVLAGALPASPGLASVPPAELKRILTAYPPDVYPLVEGLIEPRLEEEAHRGQRVDTLAGTLPGGDPERGRKVFYSQKAVCSVCHRVGQEGGQVGPDLTRIGRIRTRRDLLEAVLYPSASLARDFEAYNVETRDGESHFGVLIEDTGQEVVLGNATGQPVRIARGAILEMTASALSLMPQGIDQALTRDELADLLSFLRARQ